ncbi:MAG: MFS transporter [Phenylobacterium sp.]|uniref:MFS transporter n=1 Tax=Phenylobacterium sp. TaxID=1871053 RepID=UPI001A3011D4|nr:MFS transporter [Phenylobacterium sp.]MBJ7411800.1 MFS transporter [Phenylobacterium sp.]
MAVAPSAGEAPPLRFHTKLLYAVGATATNLKLRALSTFLVIFYNQVVGLPPQLVGSILAVAMVFDAVLDPIVGQISDNVRSRWGRRHPFMLAAALPYALAFYLLWNPPADWSHGALAIYLGVCLFAVRFFDTFFELPHQALAPELVRGYHERTNLLSLRQFFMVLGGLGMTVLAYQVFLKEQPDGTGGVLAREGYVAYSITGALIIFATIILSTLGTASRIPHLAQPPARKITLKAMVLEMAQTLNNRAFLSAALAMMFIAVAVGARNGLEIYFGLYFWELRQSQLAVLATMSVIGGFLGVLLAPVVGRVLGKKNGVIAVFATAILVHITPVTLRLLDLAPANGTTALLWLLYGEEIINATFAAATGILLASIIADVVEDAEVKTGRRSEGLLLSANNLFRKVISGMGVFIATGVLTLIAFPDKAERGQVPPEVLQNLGLAYIPTIVGLYGIAIGLLLTYNINQKRHDENLAKLADRAAEQAAAEAGPGIGSGEIPTEPGRR